MPEPILCAHISLDSVDIPTKTGGFESRDFIEIELCYPQGITSTECEYL